MFLSVIDTGVSSTEGFHCIKFNHTLLRPKDKQLWPIYPTINNPVIEVEYSILPVLVG